MRKMLNIAIIAAATLAGTSAFADADDTYVVVNLLFNNNGYQGYGVDVGVNEFEVHANKLNDMKYAVGAGFRVADTEGEGEAGNDKVGVSATLGFAVLGNGDRIRPFGRVNTELDLSGDAIAHVGVINYGLGLMDTDTYVYAGLGVQQLTANDLVANAASRSGDDTDGTDTGTDTGTDGTGDDTGDNGDTGGNGDNGDNGDGNGSGNPNDDKDGDPNDGNAGNGNDPDFVPPGQGGQNPACTRANPNGLNNGIIPHAPICN